VSLGGGAEGMGVEAGLEGDQRGPAAQGAVGPTLVVVGAEGVELELQLGPAAGGRPAAQEALEGLVEAFNLAAGLGVVGGGVLGKDAEALQLGFEQDLAPARGSGEDGAVVGEQGAGIAMALTGGVAELSCHGLVAQSCEGACASVSGPVAALRD
jgi:hypothetical protein